MDTKICLNSLHRMAIFKLNYDFIRDQEVNEGRNLAKFATRLDDFFRFGLKLSDLRRNDLEHLITIIRKTAEHQNGLIALSQWMKLRKNLPKYLKKQIIERYLE